MVSTTNSPWRWCFGYVPATVRLRAWCLLLTAHGVGASATAHHWFAFALGNYSFLHLVLVFGLRHSYCAPSRLVTTAYYTWRWCLSYGPATVRLRACCLLLTAPGVGAKATAQLLCAFELGVYCLLHLAFLLGLRHSYGAASCLVSTAYCTWRWCLGYDTAMVRPRAK